MLELKSDDKVYILQLMGGIGARLIQTAFCRSLIRERILDNNNYPILVIDNSLISNMVSNSLSDQNVHGIQVPEPHFSWPQDPGFHTLPDGSLEHPIFIENWRNQFQKFDVSSGSLHDVVMNNLSRCYQIEYGFSLTKLIHQHKYKNDRKSFIGHLYSQVIGLEYDDGLPMLKRTNTDVKISNFLDSTSKPIILMHLGMDRNGNEFASGINYRFHKVWSIQRYVELVENLKHKYTFVQVFANQFNPELPNVVSIKVDSLEPILQILESPKCRMFLSTDNNLPHLAATIKKRGIVLWGSVSPFVWGWKHNINIWNRHSCSEIACWRPGIFDTDQNGKIWVCPHYSCMKSITVKQVIGEIEKLEDILKKDENKGRINL